MPAREDRDEDRELARFHRRAAVIERLARDADRWTTRFGLAVVAMAGAAAVFHALRFALRVRGLA